MDWTEDMATRIGYMVIRETPDVAEKLLEKIEQEKEFIMATNWGAYRQLTQTQIYQNDVHQKHKQMYFDMSKDKRSGVVKFIQRWI